MEDSHHLSLQKVAVFSILALILTAGIAFAIKNLINNQISPSEIISQSKLPTLAPNTNVTTVPTVSPSTDTTNWKNYTSQTLGIILKYPDYDNPTEKYVPLKSGQPIFIVAAKSNFDSNRLTICKTYEESFCLIPGKNWNQEKDVLPTLLSGKKAVSFFVLAKNIDGGTNVIHVIQTTEKPFMEIALTVDGMGGEETFQQILSTFKFTTNGENCVAEGGKGNYTSGPRCCQSLVAADCSLSSDPPCAAMESTCFKCIKCGDGKCGNGETKCNCSTDCH